MFQIILRSSSNTISTGESEQSEKMDTREETELFFTSPMSLAKKDIEKIREVLAKAIQNSLEICKNSPAEEVVCLNIDFFQS